MAIEKLKIILETKKFLMKVHYLWWYSTSSLCKFINASSL